MCLNTSKAFERRTHLQGIKKTAGCRDRMALKNHLARQKKAARFATGG
jgi:hypothetical protein